MQDNMRRMMGKTEKEENQRWQGAFYATEIWKVPCFLCETDVGIQKLVRTMFLLPLKRFYSPRALKSIHKSS